MFGKLSIKIKLMLWYALVILLICAAALWLLSTAASRSAIQYCEDTLINAAVIIQDELEIEHGYLEIDDDIDDVPNVYAALLRNDGSLIYGRAWVDSPFEADRVRAIEGTSHSWYIYDVPIDVDGWEGTWLRLQMSSDELVNLRNAAMSHGIWFLPLLAIATLAVGYAITVRMFRPVQRMNELASSFADGSDLSARIDVNPETDGNELHRLSITINGMLERLESAFKREQQFTSDAAHELRTPLNAIITQSEYALSRESADEKDEAVARILDTAEGMNHMVRQLLMLARLESGRLERGELCQLDTLLAGVAEDLIPAAEERGMNLRAELVPCEIRADRAMLTRAVVNLLDNAVRYGRENGQISLSLTKDEQHVLISVKDDGPGLRPEELEHVFTRFWRADSSRATAGTGIGLALVDSIARAHGGSVTAHSGEPGVIFTIRLPFEK